MPRDLLESKNAAPESPDAPSGAMPSAPEKTESVPTPRAPKDLFDVVAKSKLAEEMTHTPGSAVDPRKWMSGKSPDVDYTSNLPYWDRVNLARSDNPAEAEAYLSKKYGSDNLGRDLGGDLWVNIDGKKVSTRNIGFLAGTMAAAPEIIGSGGAALATSGASIPAMIGAAGIGGMGGKLSDELGKLLQGFQRKTPGETAKAITTSGLEAAGGEVLGAPFAKGVGSVSHRYPKFMSGATVETELETSKALGYGGRPPLFSATPEAKRLQWWQDLSGRVVGPFGAKKNQQAILGELKETLAQSGVSEKDMPGVMDRIMNAPKQYASQLEAGEALTARMKVIEKDVNKDVEVAKTDADKVLDQQLRFINKLSSQRRSPELASDVAEAITDARKDFSRSAQKIYSRIDMLAGNEPLVPTIQVKKTAQTLLERLPKKDGQPILDSQQDLARLQKLATLPEKINFSDAQLIRHDLAEMGEYKNLTPSMSKHDFNKLRDSVNIAFNMAAADPKAAPAVSMLKSADKFYSSGIKKFTDAEVNRLVNNVKSGMPPDPSRIADEIVKPGFTSRAAEIKKLVGPDVWNKVGAEHLNNIISGATIDLDGRSVVSGSKLLDTVRKLDKGGMLDTVYGATVGGKIRLYAKRMAAMDGKIDASALTGDNFMPTLERYMAATDVQDKFVKENFLYGLTKPGPIQDRAFDLVVQPGEEKRLTQAQAVFGPQSVEMAAIRKAALEKVLTNAVKGTETGVGIAFNPKALEGAIRSYTKKQQEILFPNGGADDLLALAKQFKFMFPREEADMSAGLAAGAIKALPVFVYAPAAMFLGGVGWVLNNPSTIRYLALGFEGNPYANAAVRAAWEAGVQTGVHTPKNTAAQIRLNPKKAVSQ